MRGGALAFHHLDLGTGQHRPWLPGPGCRTLVTNPGARSAIARR